MNHNKIRFPLNNQREFIIELREKVSEYFNNNNISKYGGYQMAIKTIVMFIVYFAPYALMMAGVITSWWIVLACWIVMGMGKAGIGMAVMHDANHSSYSKNDTINKWLGRSLYLLGGFPPNWKHQHNTMHHGFTNVEGHDEDIDPGAFLRISPHKPLLKIHRYQHLYAWFLYGLMTISWVTTKDFAQLLRYKREGIVLSSQKGYSSLIVSLIFAKIIYYGLFMVMPMILLPFAWYWVLFFFLAMHLTSGFILTVIFQTAHVVPSSEYPMPDGNGSMENNWAVHQLLTTSDFSPKSRVLSWLIGGLNYQIEHHLFPNISHIHYRKISTIVKSTAHKYRLPYHVQPRFSNAVWAHAKMLKRLGRPYTI